MIARFSLYGFLKNQRYFEPFMVLAFLEKGVSFFQIGILVAFREICVNAIEIPSGTIADLYGRRKAMMVSFSAYIVSFAFFGLSRTYWHLFPAMFLFAIGDAFRTGTHKAMIFTWLRNRGRIDEKTRIYGYTRSWSKLGSAFSVILATILVFAAGNYSSIFYLSIVPYLLGLINFMGYPKELDGAPSPHVPLTTAFSHLWRALKQAVLRKPLRRLILESMSFEGTFAVAKDYLQPILQTMALALPVALSLGNKQRSALLVGIVYFMLYLGSAGASRNAHRLTRRHRGEENAARVLWRISFVLYLGIIPLLYFQIHAVAVLAFMALFMVQNLWRPILISRFDAYASETQGATVLSIENQSKSLATAIMAPIVGGMVDFLSNLQADSAYTGGIFWPAGLLGVLVAGAILVTGKQGPANQQTALNEQVGKKDEGDIFYHEEHAGHKREFKNQ